MTPLVPPPLQEPKRDAGEDAGVSQLSDELQVSRKFMGRPDISARVFTTAAPPPQGLRLEAASLADFEVGKVLGTGSFGRVCLARHHATGSWCAIKTLLKAHIIKNQQVPHLRSERDVLRRLDHPFVVRMRGCFQDAACVHFVMEYVAGGEFFSHLRAREQLGEEAARYYAAQVLLVFEYLHANGIVYRDLKASAKGFAI